MGLRERIGMFLAGVIVRDCNKKQSRLYHALAEIESQMAGHEASQAEDPEARFGRESAAILIAGCMAEIQNRYYAARKKYYELRSGTARDGVERMIAAHKNYHTPKPIAAVAIGDSITEIM
ncbi:hypothetical protein A3K73_09385 [Candidatus Pacearchaeota archaeon RBG_13_36_9]|nr:MAG: hypothetical protein A3K73_09385 [Candidatus Pacearchaeota archaeon RBG_13_36_9]